MSDAHVAFLATSRSGLGHLRRIANIANHLSATLPGARLTLITNDAPSGLARTDLGLFGQIIQSDTAEMARVLTKCNADLAVVDTMRLPGIGGYAGRSGLILRETPEDRIVRLARDDGRPWDMVIIPNTAEHWLPRLPPDFAREVVASGWVIRPTGCRSAEDGSVGTVLATGGEAHRIRVRCFILC